MFNPLVQFKNTSVGVVDYKWIFEQVNPGTSSDENPSAYFLYGYTGNYEVELTAISAFGCKDVATEMMEILPEILLLYQIRLQQMEINLTKRGLLTLRGLMNILL
jgi:hypothetical protein